MVKYMFKDPILQCVNLTHGYGNLERPVIRNINLSFRDIKWDGIERGQIYTILGPSGTGKSTVAEILADVMNPDAGKVFYGSNESPVKEGNVGLVDQACTLFPARKVMEQLQMAAMLQFKNSRKAYEVALLYLERFGLMHRKNAWPVELSGGEQQRIAILMPFLAGKEVIMLDEPTSRLDFLSVGVLADFLLELLKDREYLTLGIITHNLKFACIVSDIIYCLGKEHSHDGSEIPGATILREINLLDEGLEYHPDIATDMSLISYANSLEIDLNMLYRKNKMFEDI